MGQQFANMGAGLASLGERQRAADIQGAQLLDTLGRDIRAEDQARVDLSYEDFVRQREFPAQQYERIAGLLRGIPVTPNVMYSVCKRTTHYHRHLVRVFRRWVFIGG